jgi:cytochrome P450
MMARLEGEVFFQILAQNVDTITLAGEPRLRLVPGLRGLQSLPITLTARKDYRLAPAIPRASLTI